MALPRIGIGCEPLGGFDWGEFDVHEVQLAIQEAADDGFTFFDTADAYGLGASERRLAKILGRTSNRIWVSTKGGVRWTLRKGARASTWLDGTPAYLREAIEGSRRRLGLDTIPIYFLHWPDPQTDVRVSMEYLASEQQRGRIAKLGCSNFQFSQLKLAGEVAQIDMVQIPLNLLMREPSPSFIRYVQSNNIALVAYNLLAHGLLAGKISDETVFPDTDRRSRLPEFKGARLHRNLRRVRALREIARKRDLTLAEYSIAEILDRPYVASVIVGIKSRKQLSTLTAVRRLSGYL